MQLITWKVRTFIQTCGFALFLVNQTPKNTGDKEGSVILSGITTRLGAMFHRSSAAQSSSNQASCSATRSASDYERSLQSTISDKGAANYSICQKKKTPNQGQNEPMVVDQVSGKRSIFSDDFDHKVFNVLKNFSPFSP